MYPDKIEFNVAVKSRLPVTSAVAKTTFPVVGAQQKRAVSAALGVVKSYNTAIITLNGHELGITQRRDTGVGA